MGRIHGIQTMGLVDGPGIRGVVFLQGCSLRCAYCHNPDTWEMGRGEEITASELLSRLVKYKAYYDRSGGGVTFSGGEPLLQPEFLLELLQGCREQGLHTALDTAGVGLGDYEEILSLIDLVILDLKHSNHTGFKDLTGADMSRVEEFITALNRSTARVWIRHVVVPGITDGKEHLLGLKNLITTVKRVDKVELLPFHQMGEFKYEALGCEYRLRNVQPHTEEQFKEIEAEYFLR